MVCFSVPSHFVDRGSIMYNVEILRRQLVENAKSSRKFRHDISLNRRIKSTFAGIYQIPTYRLRK